MELPNDEWGKLLVDSHIVDKKTAEDLLLSLRESGMSLGEAILEKGLASDEQIGALVAKLLKIPFISLSKTSIPDKIFNIIPERVARKYKAIPFKGSPTEVKLAMVDPTNTQIVEMLLQKTGKKVTPYLATEKNLDETLVIYR